MAHLSELAHIAAQLALQKLFRVDAADLNNTVAAQCGAEWRVAVEMLSESVVALVQDLSLFAVVAAF